MAFTLPPLNLNLDESMKADSKSSSVTPMQFTMPWNQTKNYNNKGSATQSAAQSADAKHGGGSLSESLFGDIPPIMIAALGVAAYLILR